MILEKPSFDALNPEYSVKEEITAHKICAVVGKPLQDNYPGYHWRVECIWKTGIVTVKNLNLNGDYGFVLKIADILHDVENKLPVRAGGELLERCGLPRGPRPEDTSHLKRDVRGNVIGDNYGA